MDNSKVSSWGLTQVKVNRISYRWTISNYNYLCKLPGEKLESPQFKVGSEGRVWFLRLYPNGINESFKNHLSLYLCRNPNVESKFEGRYSLSVLNEKHEKFAKEKEECSYNKNYTSWGFAEFLKRDSVRDKANGLLPGNCLTIQCDVAIVVGCTSISSEEDDDESERQWRQAEGRPDWLGKLFLDERLSDVRLVAACGKSLPAHRSVLAACSPVFEAMFLHDMLERSVDEVGIADGEYEPLKEMLRFVYAAQVENVEALGAQLLRLGDKYEIAGLAALCEQAFARTISVENVLDLLVIADCHNVQHLKARALNFIKAHMKDVVNSSRFKSLSNVNVLKCIVETVGQQ